MSAALLEGKKVRLLPAQPERDAPLLSRWAQNLEYMHLLDTEPPRFWSAKGTKTWMEKELESGKQGTILLMIQPLDGEQPIGFLDLNGINWVNGDAWVGIGLGEPEYWGQGYGSDAMQVLVGYAFLQLGLHRLTLNVFEYNERAFRSYRKAGFQEEGRQREAILRDGRRWDIIFMGILRDEWLEQNRLQDR